MKRRNTITALLFLLLTAAGLTLVLTAFVGGEGKPGAGSRSRPQ